MPIFGATNCTEFTTFIKSEKRIMGFTSYWEAEDSAASALALIQRTTDYVSAVAPLWADCAPASAMLLGTRAKQWRNATFYTCFVSSNTPGDIADEDGELGLPDVLALNISKNTGLQGPRNRGRMLIPGMAEFVNDNGEVAEAALAEVNALAAYFGADRELDGVTYHARHWDRLTPAWVPITHCAVMRQLARVESRKIRDVNLPVG